MFRLETGVSRRDFLAGGISLGAFALPAVAELSPAASPQDNATIRRSAKSVIVLLQEGGHQLGIDPHQTIEDDQDRPARIMPEAEPVFELIA